LLRVRGLDRPSHKVELYNGLGSDFARVVPVAQIFIGFQNVAAGDETTPEASVRTHWYVRMDRGAYERAEFVNGFCVDIIGVGESIDVFLRRRLFLKGEMRSVDVVRPGSEALAVCFVWERGVEDGA
jgi:hypothetical protein